MAVVVALLGSAATADAQSKRPMTIMDVMELKNVGGVALSPDGSKVAYTVSGWEHPNARPSTDSTKPDTAKGDKHEMRSHIWMVPAAGGTPRQLTFSERGENNPQWSPDGRSLAFTSARGTGHVRSEGGRLGWESALDARWVARAVHGDYRDIMTGVDDVIKRGIADSSKMAFEGWSYGGYMTWWVVSQTSRFKAARMGAGLSNLESMYGTTDISGYIGTFFSGIPTKETLDFYRARSAIQFVDNVTTPLLIQHGGNDQRVPVGQAMEFFRALKDRGKTVQMVFYPRAGHGLSEYYHQIDKMQRELDWMTKYTLAPQRVVP